MPAYKNQFGRPDHHDHDILDQASKKVGTLRVKPGNILWKPANQQRFHAVTLGVFSEWIASGASGSKLVKK